MRYSSQYDSFVDAVTGAPNLKWVHFPNAGVDQHPFLPALAARKVRLTTSAGSNGEPVGQTAIAGLLLLARNFPHWWAAQGRREWKPIRGDSVPRDLRGQTVLVALQARTVTSPLVEAWRRVRLGLIFFLVVTAIGTAGQFTVHLGVSPAGEAFASVANAPKLAA